jgi:hypothetical protein
MKSLTLQLFSDASFANNKDFTCKLGFIIFLADDNENCRVLDFRSFKSQRVTRSVIGGELIAFSEAFDRGLGAKHDLEEMLEENVALRMYKDSKCLFDVLKKCIITAER